MREQWGRDEVAAIDLDLVITSNSHVVPHLQIHIHLKTILGGEGRGCDKDSD